jgi:hypothetical protein
MATAWLVGQVSSASSSDDPSYLSKTDNNNEDNNIITGGPVELRRVIIMHRSGSTTTTKKSVETGTWPVFPTTSTTTSMVVDGNDNDTDHHHQQQHDWVSQPPPPPAQKARQLQTRHEQACKLMYDDLIVGNSGASCECKREQPCPPSRHYGPSACHETFFIASSSWHVFVVAPGSPIGATTRREGRRKSASELLGVVPDWDEFWENAW